MVKNFGQLSSGETAHLYSLMTDMLRICVTDFGGTLVSVEVKDKSGKFVDITLGYDDVAGYENDNDCFGFNIGRNANRISNAQLILNMYLQKMMGKIICIAGHIFFQKECGM